MKLVIGLESDLDALLLRSYLLSLGFVDKTSDRNIKNATHIIVANNYFFGTCDYFKFRHCDYVYYNNFVQDPRKWLRQLRIYS